MPETIEITKSLEGQVAKLTEESAEFKFGEDLLFLRENLQKLHEELQNNLVAKIKNEIHKKHNQQINIASQFIENLSNDITGFISRLVALQTENDSEAYLKALISLHNDIIKFNDTINDFPGTKPLFAKEFQIDLNIFSRYLAKKIRIAENAELERQLLARPESKERTLGLELIAFIDTTAGALDDIDHTLDLKDKHAEQLRGQKKQFLESIKRAKELVYYLYDKEFRSPKVNIQEKIKTLVFDLQNYLATMGDTKTVSSSTLHKQLVEYQFGNIDLTKAFQELGDKITHYRQTINLPNPIAMAIDNLESWIEEGHTATNKSDQIELKSQLNTIYLHISSQLKNKQYPLNNENSVNLQASLSPFISNNLHEQNIGLLFSELDNYVRKRSGRAVASKPKGFVSDKEGIPDYFYQSFNSIFGGAFGGYSAGIKISGAIKLIELIQLDKMDPARQRIKFTSEEIAALTKDNLGKIIEKYRKILPTEFLRAEKEIQDNVDNFHNFRMLGI